MSLLRRTGNGRNNIDWFNASSNSSGKYFKRTGTSRNNVQWINISSNGTHNLLNRTSSGRNNISWKNTTFSFETYQSLAQEADSLKYTEFTYMDNNGVGSFSSYGLSLLEEGDRHYDSRGNFFQQDLDDNSMVDHDEENFVRGKYNPCFVFCYWSNKSSGALENRNNCENWCKKVKSVTLYQVASYPDHVNKILVPEKTLTVNSVFKDQFDIDGNGTVFRYFIGIKLNGSFILSSAQGDDGYHTAYLIYRFNP